MYVCIYKEINKTFHIVENTKIGNKALSMTPWTKEHAVSMYNLLVFVSKCKCIMLYFYFFHINYVQPLLHFTKNNTWHLIVWEHAQQHSLWPWYLKGMRFLHLELIGQVPVTSQESAICFLQRDIFFPRGLQKFSSSAFLTSVVHT